MTDLPGYPSKHRRPATPSLPVRVAELQLQRWQVIGVIVGAAATLLTSCAGAGVAIATAIRPTAVEGRLDKLDERLELWQHQNDEAAAGDNRRDKQIEFLAEFNCQLNGGAPIEGFPCPRGGTWNAPADVSFSAIQGHTTKRAWSAKKED